MARADIRISDTRARVLELVPIRTIIDACRRYLTPLEDLRLALIRCPKCNAVFLEIIPDPAHADDAILVVCPNCLEELEIY